MSVIVRAGTEADLPSVAAIYTHFTLKTTVTFNTAVRTPAAWLERYHANVTDGPYHLLVAELDGQVAGYVETGKFRPHHAYDQTCETSIYVAPDGSGNGVGSALYTQLFEVLAATDFHQAVAVVALPNDASCRFHERHGFVRRGTLQAVGRKFGTWIDTAYYQRPVHPGGTDV
jgi:phosphinothricin acetyltransferase